VNPRGVLDTIDDWLLRRRGVEEARRELAGRAAHRGRALLQAKLLAEVARRVGDPIEALPSGSTAAVALRLYQDVVYWALVAALPADREPPDNLRSLWEESPPERLLAWLGGAADLGATRALLIDGAAAPTLEATDEDLGRVRALAEALLLDLDGPRRRLRRLIIQRFLRVALVVGLVGSAAVGAHVLALGPNLAAGKSYRTSSAWSGCPADSRCAKLLFHTDNQLEPWAELDLGGPKRFRRIEITNREDCCVERSVPMIVEMSDDEKAWREIARREEEFSTWTIKLPPTTARYLRFKILKQSVLHLHDIAVRP
jgi:hypothetical protein